MNKHSYFKLISQTNAAKKLEEDFKNNKVNHAYMLIAEDAETANMFAEFFAFKILCKNNSADLTCSSCIKAQSGSNADYKSYPQKNKNIVVEDVQNLIENSMVACIEGTNKVFLLNNFENANINAQNKLLKTLEEPPKNTYLILSVSNVSNILQTIISRCKIVYADNFDNSTIKQFLLNNFVEERKAQLISEYCNNIGSAIRYAVNKDFENVLNCVFNLFINCTKSADILQTVNNILKFKENISLFLSLCENIINKALISKNTLSHVDEINSISQQFSNLSLIAISKHISQAKQKLQFNCNATAVIDVFVLKVLEEKFKWK